MTTIQNVIHPEPRDDLWLLARGCNALYLCPKQEGLRVGPLVPYAGKDAKGRNLVGDIYFNFRRIEPHLPVVEFFAQETKRKLENRRMLDRFDTVCGIPEGGRTFGQELAKQCGKRFVYALKKPKPTEPGKKQEYEWDLSQFDIASGERLAVTEDVFNNFQNTDNTLTEVGKTGARVVLLVGALNRSGFVDEIYTPRISASVNMSFPVVCALCEPYPEYEQDDPEVAADIARGNIEWEVKKNWGKLMSAMDASNTTSQRH